MTKKLFLLASIFFTLLVNSQDGSVDATFNAPDLGYGNGDGPNGFIYSREILPDGKSLIAGNFTVYNATTVNRITRLNPNGTIDSSFNSGTGANGPIYSVTSQQDGKILIGGEFSNYNGTTVYGIARLNTNGTIDNSFNVNTNANEYIYAINILPNQKIIIGGEFNIIESSVSRSNICRLNTDGSLDNSFSYQNNSILGTVKNIIVQPNNKILLGGTFAVYNEFGTQISEKIFRLNDDGSFDSSFNAIAHFDFYITSIALQQDEKIIVGGAFSSVSSTVQNKIVRLNTDGSLDLSFQTNSGFDDVVHSLLVQQNGKIIVGGSFTTYQGASHENLIRLNTDGSIDNLFVPSKDTNFYSLLEQNDQKIFVGGVRLNSNGSLDSNYNKQTGFNNFIQTIVTQQDGKILVGGNFLSYNGELTKFITRLNMDGSKDTSFNSNSADNRIRSISVLPNDKIIIGGEFFNYNGQPIKGIARLNSDGTLDTNFNIFGTGIGGSNVVNVTTIQSDGKIVIGGMFNSYNGVSTNRIARLNNDGTLDTSFTIGTGANNTVIAIAIQQDEKIIVGGAFTSFNGIGVNKIVRLNQNGSIDSSFNVGSGFDFQVFSIQIQPDGKIIVGGSFSNYNGESAKKIIRLNSDGSVDTTFNIGDGANLSVNTISIQNDGKIIVAGNFNTFNNNSVNRIIRLNSNGTVDSSFVVGNGINYQVNISCIDSDGKIILGGAFTSYNGHGKNRILRLNGPNTLSSSNYEIPNNIRITNENGYLKIISNSLNLSSISMYNVLGESLYQKGEMNSDIITIENSFIQNQILFLTIQFSNGTVKKLKFIP
ncbi:conserved exported hypothetical protein [Flavobacterium sp. 9AF]|uniref:delta-60 repeat domain-containing protein n=1 Tax=Flavobacterium sp. 9AF TaxID=2653142 RepID=UPI0012F24112|nr:delta-60 repeat domain-containing protein [Flavobacterium sp. 9AF]VXB96707.1 conserved exported hypothetical protein [Flavobacterium sp. 9AF]